MFKKLLFISLLLFLPTIIVHAEENVHLPVPYTSQIPNGRWIPPWNAACEEASIIMVEQFYLGRTGQLPKKEAYDLILPLFPWEDRVFGANKDTNAERTAQLINEYSSFNAAIKTFPTLEDIKEELRNNRPVISLHYGRGLNNPKLHFRAEGSSYHMIVIIGFDDEAQEFITHDPGFVSGLDERYPYATILDSLHDFDHEREQADGVPVALFTTPRVLVKVTGSPTVYLVQEDTKYPIAHSGIFNQRRWSWKAVKRVEKEWLDQFSEGELIK